MFLKLLEILQTAEQQKHTSYAISEVTVQVMTNETEVFEQDYVAANCSIPLMVVISHPQWEFTFRNKTQNIVSPGLNTKVS